MMKKKALIYNNLIEISSAYGKDITDFILPIGTKGHSVLEIFNHTLEDKPISDILKKIVSNLGSMFSADRVIVTIKDMPMLDSQWQKEGSKIQAADGLLEDWEIAGAWFNDQLKLIWIADIANAGRIDETLRETWLNAGIQSVCVLPIHVHKKTIVMMVIYNAKLSPQDIAILNLIGILLGNNVYLYQKQLRLEEKTYRDVLTGALNQEGFCNKASELLKKHRDNEYVVCISDIRYFSNINRNFGYELGNKILQKRAELLAEVFDEEEAFGRISADEFCMLMKYRSIQYCEENFYRHVKKMQCFEELKRQNTTIDLQSGLYLLDKNAKENELKTAMDMANIARKTLKEYHGSRIAIFTDELFAKNSREAELTQSLQKAIENGEIMVYYQPQYRYSTGKMIGAEALVRWNSPKYGWISPAEFIPLLEKNGMIYQLDQYVWETVCKSQRGWMEEGIGCRISVNVSRFDVTRSDVCGTLCRFLKKYKIPKYMLHLEITETAYMDNSDILIRAVNKLKKAGFTVEMDDFGSGYSSLNALKDVDVDLLKLDMRFLSMDEESARGKTILQSVVQMANWIGLPVMAEGVETKEQADYLCHIGCDMMQGYYFAKPMDKKQLEHRLKKSLRKV